MTVPPDVCVECAGAGWTVIDRPVQPRGDDRSVRAVAACPDCHGTGRELGRPATDEEQA